MSERDHWSSSKYKKAAGFVPKLTSTVLSYLDIQNNDQILDLGCGDGQLTSRIASVAHTGYVLGLDASPSLVQTARDKNHLPNCAFRLQDCTRLSSCSDAVNGSWDKVFSNAALHWMLRNPATRDEVLRNAYRALKPGGKFVFEMGGKGNVAEFHSALTAALLHVGLTIEEAEDACPWFFPSVQWMDQALTDVGFAVEKCEMEYRPTKATAETDDGGGGIAGWVRLMGAQALAVVEEEKREAVVREVCNVVDGVITREEDGSKWIGYVRLRAVARKP